MYSVDLQYRTIVPDDRSFTLEEEYRLNDDILRIENLLLMIANRERWITPTGGVTISAGFENIGSNIFTTYLSNLFLFDEDQKLFVMNEEIKKRFENNPDNSPEELMEDVERILRMRFGDVVIERFINRLLYMYFKTDQIAADANNEVPGLSLFTQAWWVLFAMQSALMTYDVEYKFKSL